MNVLEDFRKRSGQARRPSPLLIYTTGVSALGIALLMWAVSQISSYPRDALLFVGLVVVAGLTTRDVLAKGTAFSMSTAVTFAMLLLFGPLPAALASMVGGLVITGAVRTDDIREGKSRAVPLLQRAIFEMAARGLSVVFAGGVYRLFKGTVGDVARLSNLPPLALAAVSYEFMSTALVVAAVSLQTGKRPFDTWRQSASWAIPIHVVTMLIGGAGLALGYQIAGPFGAVVFLVPLLLTIYASRLYVAQTRARVKQLEADIAERERIEVQLKASLHEKATLLQEIHHRMKNNLQVISSLLHLQGKDVRDQRTLDMFKKTQNRVRSMALVHEKLCQSEDLTKIEFASYVKRLADSLLRSYGVSWNAMKLTIHVDDVRLGIDTAIPCGLIINELVSNALRHAFVDGTGGEVRIELRARDGRFILTVADNGLGMPSGLDFRNTKSLGLRLVCTLVGQLEGSIELDRSAGTVFKITFLEPKHAAEVQP